MPFRLQKPRGFTLVELLVVIAIIAILIAILLPVCIKVRIRALVLVCPIAYVGEDGGVYLTDPKGSHSVQISRTDTSVLRQHAFCGPLSWSPCGRRLAYNSNDRIPGPGYSYFSEPSSGRLWKGPQNFSGWIDSETFLGMDRSIYKIYDENMGGRTALGAATIPNGDPFYESFAPTPIGADFPYIAGWYAVDGTSQVGYVRKNYRPGRVICKSPDIQAAAYLFPKIDPFNEYAAWGLSFTSIKQLRQDPSLPPTQILGTFCDWTEDGNVLTNLGNGTLAIYTKNGKLVRTLSPAVKPMFERLAAYRKYGHH